MKQGYLSTISKFLLVALVYYLNVNTTIAQTNQVSDSHSKGKSIDRSDIAFESYPLTKKLFYPRPHRMAVVGKDMNANGAWGKLNSDYDSAKTGLWYIELQRYGADVVVAGIVKDDSDAIERGMIALEWGMKQQQPDGSFHCPDDFHSTSFYIEGVANSCLLLKQSKYYGKYEVRINALKNCIAKAANWMLRPDVLERGTKRNNPYTHRRYLVAAAIGQAGVLCGNDYFIKQSDRFIKEGISLQDTAGFNPEKKGYDCSYHAVGLLLAHRYIDIVADESQKKELLTMYAKGIKWLLTRIDTAGNINGEGNTRTGFGQEKSRDGKPKSLNAGCISNALLWWALYTGDKQLEALAEKVFVTGRMKAK